MLSVGRSVRRVMARPRAAPLIEDTAGERYPLPADRCVSKSGATVEVIRPLTGNLRRAWRYWRSELSNERREGMRMQ